MEDIIRKIISIDTNAKDILVQSEQEMKLRERAARDDFERMTNKAMEKAREDGRAIYEDMVRKAQEEGEGIRQRAQHQSQVLEERYQAIRDRLEAELFNKIFK
jgi:vacuolar-type H+-ATPase subunit H